jgi:2-polyprenyl-3-methyl-5-hydroxy-6-metoxy-1,4-benzoquinol methylase
MQTPRNLKTPQNPGTNKASKVRMQSKTNVQNTHPEWPVDGLESVPSCPVCGADVRELLHEGLTDRVFFCAPGKWNMYQCKSCASAYLDPRPTSEAISLAYQRYFTHDEAPGFSSLSSWGKLRRRFANGYRNHHYGTQDYPASILGILVVNLMPNVRAIIDAGMRHLPKVKKGKRLLDLGCGNGAFLLSARSAGWDVIGVDFDAKAVSAACSQGLDIRLGGVESLDPSIVQFDVITLAHVIEHVHNPVEVLQACYSLLKPDGYLWIETPNIASEGHQSFGMNWRGLEPPRHLVLFTLDSMRSALNKVGFTELKVQPYRPLCDSIFGASAAISKGIDPYSDSRRNVSSEMVKKAEQIARCNPERREFITVKAWKK